MRSLSRQEAGRPVPLTLGTNVVILAAAAAGGVASARVLGPAGRGQVALLVVWSHLSYMVSTLGMPQGVTYLTAQATEEWFSIGRHTVKLAISHAAVALVLVVIAFATLAARGRVSFATSLLFVAWAPLSTVSLYGTSFVQGQGRFRLFNALRLLSGALPGAAALLLASFGMLTVGGLGAVYGLATLAATLVAVASTRELRSPKATPLTLARRSQLKDFSRRNFAVLLTSAANNRVDQLVLSVIAPMSVLGTYAVATTAASVIIPLSSGASMVAFPRVAAARNRAERLEQAVPFIRNVSVVALVLAIAFVTFAGSLVPLVYGPRFQAAIGPARVMGVAMVFASINVILADVLRGSNRPGRAAAAEAVGGAVTAVGVCLAGGSHLVIVAAASAAGFAATCLLSWWSLERRQNRPHRSRRVGVHARESAT